MLNISKNSIAHEVNLKDYKSYRILKNNNFSEILKWALAILLILLVIILFLPWTQNINAKGYVTTRSPQQRPQAIQSVLAGRIEKWYVNEGDLVKQGDTIAFMSEVKSDYFDPNILTRTEEQLDAKSASVTTYNQKATAIKNQYQALAKAQAQKNAQIKNKIIQAQNKIDIEQYELEAMQSNLQIAENQYQRTKELYDQGLKTLTELQDKEYKVQNARAKVNVQLNKLSNQQNELGNLNIELAANKQEYLDKRFKAQSDQQSAVAAMLESKAAASKLKNQLSNYEARQKFYYITAPQDGFISKTVKKGIGENVKEGTDIAMIMPTSYDLAIEIYIDPQDVPLVAMDDNVRIRFDGWPAIVISGWPEASTGVFSGKVVSIDRNISDNGKYRILASPLEDKKKWPRELSIGTGANAFLLLNKVPIWYEFWRQLNGFPPDYYRPDNKAKQDEVKRKAPIKSVK